MDFGSEFPRGIPEVTPFPPGHYWAAACVDMEDKDHYTQDYITGG